MKETVTGGAGEGGEAGNPGAVDGAEHGGLGAGSDDLPGGGGRGGDGDGGPGDHLLPVEGGDGDGGGLGLARHRDHATRAWTQKQHVNDKLELEN